MITVVTTHQYNIFKLFYENRLHKKLTENLIVYIDKEDLNEINEFKSIIDLSKTKIFTRNDIIEYYKDLYLSNAPYCKKMYFLNMLAEKGYMNDDIYMTDDDILVYDESFYDILKENKIIHDKDTWPKIEKYKDVWPNVYNWYKDNMGGKPLYMMATNFFIPKIYIKEFSDIFIQKFSSFIRLLKNEHKHIDYLNSKIKTTRNCSFLVFYLEVPFFDDVFTSLNVEYFKKVPIYCVAPSELIKIMDKYNTKDTSFIIEKFLSKSKYPKKQPLVHFNLANKYVFMNETFNVLNNKNIKYPNIHDLLKHYPRQFNKSDSIVKTLF